MADRPIIFSGPMVRALLEGRKSQTRRVIKPDWIREDVMCIRGTVALTRCHPKRPCLVGDRLWVREAWRCEARLDKRVPRDIATNYPGVKYVATDEPDDFGIEGRFRQARHMPRWASRLTLIVTDVRVQRLQEISEWDAREEGVSLPEDHASYREPHKLAYANLWDSLNASRGYGWESNPWVVALTFSVIKANIDSLQEAA